jgi:hypothetical protein
MYLWLAGWMVGGWLAEANDWLALSYIFTDKQSLIMINWFSTTMKAYT